MVPSRGLLVTRVTSLYPGAGQRWIRKQYEEAQMTNGALQAAGRRVARSALAGCLLWVGALKFAEYEAENIRPMVSTSPLFSRIDERLGYARPRGS